jgi:hypothetical protein
MLRNEVGRIEKNNITLIEYENAVVNYSSNFFIQLGVVGVHCTQKELEDLYTVLGYYLNIDNYSECKIKIGGEYVAIQ